MLVAGEPVAVRTLAELIAKQKASRDGVRSGRLRGRGDAPRDRLLNQTAGVRAVHVPPGPGDAISDAIANVVRGEIDYALSPISAAAPYLPDGQLSRLASAAPPLAAAARRANDR